MPALKPSTPPKYDNAIAHQSSAIMPSPIMAPKKTKRPLVSFSTQRAINGDCVAWKPDTAPQAMVMNSAGQSGMSFGFKFWKKSPACTLGSKVCSLDRIIAKARPNDMKNSKAPKKGYKRPIILSTGTTVAIR